MKKQQGFTLIELVVVIIILGILAVTAAPKFINLQGDARASALQGLKGAIQGANSLVYSKAALLGIEGASTGSVDVLGNTVAGESATGAADDVPVVFGYMAATKAALEAGMDITASDWTFTPVTPGTTPAKVVIEAIDAPDNCNLTYTEAATAGALPTYVIDDSGC